MAARSIIPRPKCVACGAPYGRRGLTQIPLTWKRGEEMPAYRGNTPLLGSRHTIHAPPAHENRGYHETWDGKTWIKAYEPFCTLRCALSYAKRAYYSGRGK